MNTKYIKLLLKYFLFILIIFVFAYCTEDEFKPKDNKEFVEVFEAVWSDFDEIYSYFTHKNVDWDSVYTLYSSKIEDIETEFELSELIGEMTLEVKDIHVRFKSPYHYMKYSGDGLYAENPPDFAVNYIENKVIENDFVEFADVKETNFSYLRIKNFSGSGSSYSESISKLKEINNKDGLIIDIRSNPGGSEIIGREFAGALSNMDRVYRYSRYRDGVEWDDFTPWYAGVYESTTANVFEKKIILLTNRKCYSSAELFALMMDVMPNVEIVGDTTFGASANPKIFYYNDDWEVYISQWQLSNINYELIEDKGIAPDYRVVMTQESMIENKDLILEKAIVLLNNQL